MLFNIIYIGVRDDFYFHLTFYDLYYAYNDNSCVSEPAGKLAIYLKDYLLIGGWINASILIMLRIIIAIINIFSIILNIFGAFIFWSLMDTSDCNK